MRYYTNDDDDRSGFQRTPSLRAKEYTASLTVHLSLMRCNRLSTMCRSHHYINPSPCLVLAWHCDASRLRRERKTPRTHPEATARGPAPPCRSRQENTKIPPGSERSICMATGKLPLTYKWACPAHSMFLRKRCRGYVEEVAQLVESISLRRSSSRKDLQAALALCLLIDQSPSPGFDTSIDAGGHFTSVKLHP